jgi:hypothetical protein
VEGGELYARVQNVFERGIDLARFGYN